MYIQKGFGLESETVPSYSLSQNGPGDHKDDRQEVQIGPGQAYGVGTVQLCTLPFGTEEFKSINGEMAEKLEEFAYIYYYYFAFLP